MDELAHIKFSIVLVSHGYAKIVISNYIIHNENLRSFDNYVTQHEMLRKMLHKHIYVI